MGYLLIKFFMKVKKNYPKKLLIQRTSHLKDILGSNMCADHD